MQTRNYLAALLSFLLLSPLAVSTASGAPASAPPETFSVAEAAGLTEITLPVANGTATLTLLDTRQRPQDPLTVSIEIGQLHGEYGDSVPPQIVVYSRKADRVQKDVKVEGSPVELTINAALPNPGNYQGFISFTSSTGAVKTLKLKLSRAAQPRPATLLIDQRDIVLSVTRSPTCFPLLSCSDSSRLSGIAKFFGIWDSPTFSLRLQEKNKAWPLQDVNVRLDGAAKGPEDGFDLRNVEFTYDGKPASAVPYSVPASKQVEVVGKIGQLKAGDYSATMRFTAANSTEDDAQKLNLTIHVRDSLFWVIVVLATGIVVSLGGTKLVGSWRKRIKFQQRIVALRPDDLARDEPSLPVIWARATLSQIGDLGGKTLIAGADVIDQRLTQVERVAGVLDAARRIRASFEGINDPLLRSRADTALGDVLKQLDPERLDDQTADKCKTQINALAQWVDNPDDPEPQRKVYWDNLSFDITKLINQIESNKPGDDVKSAIEQRIKCLQDAQKAPLGALGVVKEFDRVFQVLRLLWRWRGQSEVTALLAVPDPEHHLDEFFKAADDSAWARITPDNLKVELRNDTGVPVKAYETLLFDVSCTDSVANNSYLFKHVLKYRWELKPTDASKLLPELKPETSEPHLAQYEPGPGAFTVKVTAVNHDRQEKSVEYVSRNPEHPNSITVDPSTRFAFMKELIRVELVSTAIVAVLALVSGISLNYKSATFGSLGDYLLLFLWGAGLDQGKNWLQIGTTYFSDNK